MDKKEIEAGLLQGLIVLVCLCFIIDSYYRGPWLDEFWSYWRAQRSFGFFSALRELWLPDINQPFYSSYLWLTEPLTGDHIFPRRLTNFLAVGYLLAQSAYQIRHRSGNSTAVLFYTALVLASPLAIMSFANLRSYFFQIAASASLALLFMHAGKSKDFSYKTDIGIVPFVLISTLLAFNIHIMATFINALALLAGLAAILWIGQRRWAMIIAGGSALSVFCLAITLVFQWQFLRGSTAAFPVDTGAWQGAMMALTIFAVVIIAAPLATFAATSAVHEMRGTMTASREQLLGGALILAAAIAAISLVAVNELKPFLSFRYFYCIMPFLLAGLIMFGSDQLFRSRALVLGSILLAAAAAVASASYVATRKNWDATAAIIEQESARCPSSPIVALLPTQVSQNPPLLYGGEERVLHLGYQKLSRWHGFTLSEPHVSFANRGACPILVWVEHFFGDPSIEVIAQQLHIPAEYLDRHQVIHGASGFVIKLWPKS